MLLFGRLLLLLLVAAAAGADDDVVVPGADEDEPFTFTFSPLVLTSFTGDFDDDAGCGLLVTAAADFSDSFIARCNSRSS
jgi:hypothetical protein